MAHKTYTSNIVYNVTLHNAIDATATSSAQLCAGAKAISLFFTKANTDNNLQATLTAAISENGTDFHAYNMLIDNVANANDQNLTRVASKTRSTDGTDVLWFTSGTLGAINYFKVTLTVTGSGNGNFTVKSLIQY